MFCRENGVRPMAIGTVGRTRGSQSMADSMNTRGIGLAFCFVATSAVRRLGGETVIWMLRGDIRMASRTRVRPVDSSRELRLIDKKADFLPKSIGFGKSFV